MTGITGQSGISPRSVVGLVVVALLAGMALRGCVDSTSVDDRRLPVDAEYEATEPGAGPWRVEEGIPEGFARTEAGAISAAASYVVTGQVLLDLPPTQLRDTVSLFAAAETAEQQTSDLTNQLDALRETLADGQGRTRYLQAVLATRIEAFSDSRARVAVWSVGVLWRHGAADPQAGWTTSSFDLVWEDGTWKVWAETVTSGPSPAPNAGVPPVDAAELDRQLAGFEPWTMIR